MTMRVKQTLLVAGFLMALIVSAKADVDIIYSGKLTQLPKSALFALTPSNRALVFQPGRNLFRLWGADISGTSRPVEVPDVEYHCRRVGEVLARNFGRAFIVECNSGGIDLSGLLIRQGLALEICSETGNNYGTCSQRKDAK